MDDSKRLYFIPIIARALKSDNPQRAMDEAFDEIRELGSQQEYEEGFRQFMEFAKAAVTPSGAKPEQKAQLVRDAIYRLIHDLAADTFEGDEDQKEALINALRSSPEWNAEYESIKEEAPAFLASKRPMEIEVLKEDQVIGSFTSPGDVASIGSIAPGRYTVRLSNGRVLWKGDLTKEDLIWTYAFPGKDLAMAAETEPYKQEPTKAVSLLDGELIMQVFAGLESGEVRIKSGQGI